MAEPTSNSSEPLVETDLSGRHLGDFRLLRRLGQGAMAEVYLAEQGSLGRQVAVKVLKASLASDATYVRRFHNEAHAAASLVHANIVQIYDVGSEEGVHYIVQEFVPGENLHQFLLRQERAELKLALAIMRQVAAALSKAAAAGIVHRDIKPENIMLARTGEVKVADFGLARVTGENGQVQMTQAGVTMGTPLYMSPEQVEGKALDPRSDIYSFGVTCYQMLAGRLPFRGDTALGVAVQHLHSQPQRLEGLRPDLPPALCRIVHKMLAKSPDDRYADARKLLQDLRGVRVEGDEDWGDGLDDADSASLELFAEREAATQRLGDLMKTSTLATVRRRRRRWWLTTAWVAIAALGAFLSWVFSPPFLLADANANSVTRQRTAQDQLYFARRFRTEAWLKSVEQYFPQAEPLVRVSRRDLARFYLLKGREQEALRLFREIARDRDSVCQAYGLAGEFVVQARQRHDRDALDLLNRLKPLFDPQLDPTLTQQMRGALAGLLERSQGQLDRPRHEELQEWLNNGLGPHEPNLVDNPGRVE